MELREQRFLQHQQLLRSKKRFGNLEWMAVGIIILYVLNYFRGKQQNEEVARCLWKSFCQDAEDQFALIGVEDGDVGDCECGVDAGDGEGADGDVGYRRLCE